MYAAYRKLPLARDKRYLVFGDIHGRYETFTALLEKIGHDPERDIVCSVGDLIDRGPDPIAVVEFFRQPHCHVVRGNHEQMVANLRVWHDVWLDPQNGGWSTLASLWRYGLDRTSLETFCRGLPLVLDVGEEDEPGAFRLVHAESPFAWSETELQRHLARQTAAGVDTSRLLWGRGDVTRASLQPPGSDGARTVEVHPDRSPRAVFCGHTPLEAVLTASGTHWIDTWQGEFLTCIEPATLREYHQLHAAVDRL